jgi:Skp family chaperone for outer membrane proteins
MRGLLGQMVWGAVLGGAICLPATALQAQQTAPLISPILTLDQDALYARSQYGQALRARLSEAFNKVEAESRRIDAELEAEERALTVQRSQMSQAEFAPLAAAFDEKVRKLRAENAAAADTLRQKEQEGRQEFIATAAQIIGDYMVERGAVAIIDKDSVIVSLLGLDVTDEVVERIDAVLGAGAPALP